MIVTIADIQRLAAESFQLPLTGDEYADRMHEWTADERFRGEPMWWGQKQPYYVFLYKLAKMFSGGMAVEVGTARGLGFAHLAAGAKDSLDPKSWTVGIDKDNHQTTQDIAKHYPNTTFLNGLSSSPEVVKAIEEICMKQQIGIKIIFIDATHTIWWVKEEIYRLKHLFADQVVVIMDDVIHAANNTLLPQCFSELPGSKELFPNLHTDNCIGVSVATRSDFDNWVPQPPEKLTV